MHNNSTKILIIGPGALGVALGILFLKAGFKNILLINRAGSPLQQRINYSLGTGTAVADFAPRFSADKAELCFFTTKAYDLCSAVTMHQASLSSSCLKISLANGAIWDDFANCVSKVWDPSVCRIGSSKIGVRIDGAGIYHISNIAGKINWGPFPIIDQAATPQEKLVLDATNFSQYHPNPLPYLQEKWLYNAVMNTLAAELKLANNGALREHREKADALLLAAYRTGEQRWGAWRFTYDEARSSLWTLVEQTATNENSMARDVREGRKTEAPYFRLN